MSQNQSKNKVELVDSLKDDRDDISLLKAIAQHKEQRALAVLFERYRKPAFNLAYRMTRQHETAMDILQETMLTVWQTAGNYREAGQARSWLLRIVALKSMRALRDQGRKRRGLEIKKTLLVQQSSGADRDPLEHDDVLGSLRSALKKLAAADQELLALRFGAGLNWVQMGQTLGLPSRGLRYRVTQCLEKLRNTMHKDGATACGMLTTASQLHEAFCSGIEVPPDLNEWINDRASEIAQAPVSNQQSLSVLKKSGTRLILLAGSFVALVAGVLMNFDKLNYTPQPPESTPVLSQLSEAKREGGVSQIWTFEKPPLGLEMELEVLRGSWDWMASKHDKLGAMAIGQDPFVLRPKLRLPAGRPLRVELTLRPNLSNQKKVVDQWSFVFGAMWNSSHKQQSKSWRNRKPFSPGNRKSRSQAFVVTTYLFGSYEITTVNGDAIFNIIEYKQPFTDEWAVLLLQNVLLERIVMRTISLQELPKKFRNPKELIEKLTASGKLSIQPTTFIPAEGN